MVQQVQIIIHEMKSTTVIVYINFVWWLQAIIFIVIDATNLRAHTDAIEKCGQHLWVYNLAYICFLGIMVILLHMIGLFFWGGSDEIIKHKKIITRLFNILAVVMVCSFVPSIGLMVDIGSKKCTYTEYPNLINLSTYAVINSGISTIIILLDILVWNVEEDINRMAAQQSEMSVISEQNNDGSATQQVEKNYSKKQDQEDVPLSRDKACFQEQSILVELGSDMEGYGEVASDMEGYREAACEISDVDNSGSLQIVR